MFHYSICNIADESVFQKQCKALEKFVPQIRKEELLHDVDVLLRSCIQQMEK